MLERVQYLLDKRIIREITPIFDTRAFGYGSMLVAAKVDPAFPHRAAQFINTHPGVTHNYLRDHDFNLWFTIAVEPGSKLGLDGTLDVIAAKTGAESIRQLPTLKLFKIRMDLEMEAGTDALSTAGEAVEPMELEPIELTEEASRRSGRRGLRAVGSGADGACGRSGSACAGGLRRWRAGPTRSHGRRSGRADGARADRAVRRGHRDGPCDAGPDAGGPRALRAGGGAARRPHRRPSSSASPRSRRGGCVAWPRSSTTAAPASRRTAWASGPCPTDRDPRDRQADGGVPRHLALLPAPDLQRLALLRLHDGPRPLQGGVRRRPRRDRRRRPGIEQRATLYSSTEFKKVRMLYFTDAFARWEQEHGS